jgi:hypothetical protein
MNLDGSKMLSIEIGSVLALTPLAVWLALYVAAHWWPIDLRSVLPWLRTLRWVAWGLAIVLLATHLVQDHFSLAYGASMSAFQLGLALPESWVRHRFAPDLIESPDGYWPTKRD